MEPREGGGAAAVDLLWIPLGAGAHVVRLSGRAYEALVAWRDRRPRCDLYHSALLVAAAGDRWAIESGPESGGPRDARGVVAGGAVGVSLAGRWRIFRYEIRCRRGGSIPDERFAVGGPVRLSEDPWCARRILELAPSVPTPVWGRDELRTGDMWNSNSLTSWLLERAGVDIERVGPPQGGRAPGWVAGRTVARRRRDP
jgi:hypothetical protein